MCKQRGLLAAVIGLLMATGCNDTDPTLLDPTPLRTGLTSTIGIHPSVITAQSIGQPFCPTIPPFLGSLNLTVQAPGALRVFLRQVRMEFVDSAGMSAPSITLPAPVLTQQFGSTLIEARSGRTFPFTFPFGCGTRRGGTLVVIVIVADENGQETSARAQARIQ